MERERIEEIKKRLQANQYFVNPLSDVNVKEDMSYLMTVIQERNQRIQELQAMNKKLAEQIMELTQEIENVKSDFGGDFR